MSKTKKIIFVIISFAILICSLCIPVSADSISVKGLSFTGLGYFTNTQSNVSSIPDSVNSNCVYPDNTTFKNAVSIWASYDNVILNSSQYGYQDIWIDPFEIGTYTMTFAVDYSIYRISDIVIHNDNDNFSNGSYKYLGIQNVNGKSWYLVQFTFNVPSINNSSGFTGGYIRVGLQCYKNNINYFGAFVLDIVSNTSTGQILENQQQNTQSIIDNQNSNTQDIIDNQNALAEQEKGEIQQSGDQATDSVDDVPDQSQGFISALGDLVTALSYNGTECKWTLPQVKMPQIANIVPEMTLIEQQDIDFGVWVQKMPSNILTLIQYVCSGALIVYCFKELYGAISYVLTLKGGGN